MAVALDPKLALTQYIHRKWTRDEGVPFVDVRALAQTADGYLWIGSRNGLYRFDGVRFVSLALPDGGMKSEILSLAASKGGALWIGRQSRVDRLDEKGHFRSWTPHDGLPQARIQRLMEDRDGRLWVSAFDNTGSELVVITAGGSVIPQTLPPDVRTQQALSVFQDSHDALWIVSSNLCRIRLNQTPDCLATTPLEANSITEDPQGLLISDSRSGKILRLSGNTLSPITRPTAIPSRLTGRLLSDRDHNIWVATAGNGLVRLNHSGAASFTPQDGLSNGTISTLLEDNQGTIWAGTQAGLDCFRDPIIPRISAREGMSSDFITAIAAANEGGVWVGTANGIDRVTDRVISHFSEGSRYPVEALFEDIHGLLWASTPRGLAYMSLGKLHNLPDRPFSGIYAITGDEEGRLWITEQRRGLLEVRRDRVSEVTAPGFLNRNIVPLLRGKDGTLWAGYFAGGVAALKDGVGRLYGDKDGLASGRVRAIYESAPGTIWIATEGGVSRHAGGSWTTWTERNGLPSGGIQGLAVDDEGGLWLLGPDALLRCRAADFSAQSRPSDRRIDCATFGEAEGIHLNRGAGMMTSRIVKSTDGRIWAATLDGIAVIDPVRLRRRNPPQVRIEDVLVDRAPRDTADPHALTFRGREVQIDYTALGLAEPANVTFRYRLEGLDEGWTNAGTRRDVVYAGLPPRRYRFRIVASSGNLGDGPEAALVFEIAPYWYQTTWFKVMLVLAAIAALAAAAWVRKRLLDERFRLVLEERSRMTRELHDTLLQGFTAVTYQLEAASRQFDRDPNASRARLQGALGLADHALKEARHTIAFLRLPEIEDSNLLEVLRNSCKDLASDPRVTVDLRVSGQPYVLPYSTQWNVYLMTREAVTNSLNHATPKCVNIQIEYLPREMLLSIEDDGSGFRMEEALSKQNHWGLRNLQERSQHIGASIAIESQPGMGTKVRIRIPRNRSDSQY